MKSGRHEAILELISKYDIQTQDELIEKLSEQGFDVTQATVSRDVRQLKLTKTSNGRGGYHYTVSASLSAEQMHFNSAIVQPIKMVEACNTLIVLTTSPGLASAVAASVDNMKIPQIVGCIAGDDTILIVVRDPSSAVDLAQRIHSLIMES